MVDKYVDFHMHYAPTLIDEVQLMGHLDRFGIERAVMLGLPEHICYDNLDLKGSDNEAVMGLWEHHPERIVPAVHVNLADVLGAQKEIMSYYERGVRIVKTFPALSCPLDEPRIYPVYDLLNELGMAVLFHSGMLGKFNSHYGKNRTSMPRTNSKFGQPVLLDEPARIFPNLKFVIAHTAYPWTLEAVEMSYHHDNVYVDFSCPLGVEGYRLLEKLRPGRVKWDKFLWGSDTAGDMTGMRGHWNELEKDGYLAPHAEDFFRNNGNALLKEIGAI